MLNENQCIASVIYCLLGIKNDFLEIASAYERNGHSSQTRKVVLQHLIIEKLILHLKFNQFAPNN